MKFNSKYSNGKTKPREGTKGQQDRSEKENLSGLCSLLPNKLLPRVNTRRKNCSKHTIVSAPQMEPAWSRTLSRDLHQLRMKRQWHGERRFHFMLFYMKRTSFSTSVLPFIRRSFHYIYLHTDTLLK